MDEFVTMKENQIEQLTKSLQDAMSRLDISETNNKHLIHQD